MSTREELMNKLAEEHFKKATPFMTDKEREHYLEDHSRSQTLTAFHAGQKAADAHPDQSLLAENARLRSALRDAIEGMDCATQTAFENIWRHLIWTAKEKAKEALSQSPAEEYVPLKDVMPLVEALRVYGNPQNWRYKDNGDVGAFDAWLDFKPGHYSKVRENLGIYIAKDVLAAFEKARGK